ncbi:MAG: ABC transporter ATP-binding protein, partial [Acidobacteria bacterium]|nr:ABC transporter ATP-binding protein [Acidobacteriota bacterium]
VSMTCQRVVIIKQGRIVAEDTPQNLTARLKGSEILVLTVEGSEAEARETASGVAGVVGVRTRSSSNGTHTFEIEKTPGRDIRSSLARAIVHSGLGLLELKQQGMSLEDIFLQLTTEEAAPAAEPAVPPAATGETGQAEVH